LVECPKCGCIIRIDPKDGREIILEEIEEESEEFQE